MGSEFQKSKSESRISTSKIPCVPIFSQNEQLSIFRPVFGEIALLNAIFGSNNVDGVPESWVEVDGAWRRWMELGGDGWSWVKVDGTWWRWIKLGGGGWS